MATTYYQDIQKLYVAYFNRPADSAGLAYWEGVVEGLGGSTAAVSAAFSQENEYKDAYAGMSNADIVDKVYQNLFGRAAEADGKAYWAALLDQGAITIDKVVTEVAHGAQGSDAVAYANKVVAAGSFTLALVTPEQQHAYSGAAANAQAKAFMSAVTDDVSLDAALSNGSLDAAIASVVAAGPFDLQAGVQALQSAQAAHAAFLDAADGQADGQATLTDAAINDDLAAKIAALNALVPGGDLVHASAGVRAALLADAQAAAAHEVADANKVMFEANASLGRMSGLVAAVAAVDDALAALNEAESAYAGSGKNFGIQLSAYEELHQITLVVGADHTVAGLVERDGEGQLVLVAGVTEETHAGVTALRDALVRIEETAAAYDAAGHAWVDALDNANYLDMGATEKADLQAIAAAMVDVPVAANALPTLAQIAMQQSLLATRADAAAAELAAAGAGATQAQVDAAAATALAAGQFGAQVDHYLQDATANARIDAAAAARFVLQQATDHANALADTAAGVHAATELATQLTAVNATVDAAAQAFIDHGMALPLPAAGAMAAGGGSEVFLAGAADAAIAQFGQQGHDALYIGAAFTLNTDMEHGDDALLEAFVSQQGADTRVVLEHDAAASHAATPGVTTITLVGVEAAQVHLANGVITVS